MTETLYKLTRDDYTTRDGYKWEIGKTHRATGKRGQGLCTDEYLHCYRSLAQAAMMQRAHGCGDYTRALEVEGKVHEDDGCKVGVRRCVVIREAEPVELTAEQRVAIAIVCALNVYRDAEWLAWAWRWLSGLDRSASSASSAAAAAAAAAYAAAYASSAAAAACYAAGGINVAAACDLVLSTPESEWEGVLEVSDE